MVLGLIKSLLITNNGNQRFIILNYYQLKFKNISFTWLIILYFQSSSVNELAHELTGILSSSS